ncbi:MAG TPA: DUF6152 family protein [Terriglobia bacterium]|jgi:hypothetical protein
MIKVSRRRLCCLAVLVTCCFAGANVLTAHHSFAMFDTTKSMALTGTVTKFEWTNPHAYIEIDVPEGNAVKHWSIELGSPSILQQSGWKFKDLKHGDKISVKISPLRSGEPGGLLVQATLADGRTLGNGPGRGPSAATAPTK